MTYNFNGDYINVAEIKYIHTDKSDDQNYPFRLSVNFKSGGSISTVYQSKKGRDAEAARIAAKMDVYFEAEHPQPLSTYQVQLIASAQIDKVRRDIRALKLLIVEKEEA